MMNILFILINSVFVFRDAKFILFVSFGKAYSLKNVIFAE